ncbi:hypothetical protein [Lysinibacillus sphaericus]|uniref:hypothetical protein n=1 Tax=Lysinibacillus sphaericus TaxID=1421 RepID=UPI0005602F8A|nr:hypothetical protein [Lysinibacillus sphaericus]
MTEIESKLRNQNGRLKATIKKKNHVIRTIDHHNNRLGNQNRALEACIKCRNKEIEMLVDLLKFFGIESELMDFSKRVDLARKALQEC